MLEYLSNLELLLVSWRSRLTRSSHWRSRLSRSSSYPFFFWFFYYLIASTQHLGKKIWKPSISLFENMKCWQYLKASREDNRKSVGVCIEKLVAKVESCTFSLGILATVGGDSLRSQFGTRQPCYTTIHPPMWDLTFRDVTTKNPEIEFPHSLSAFLL
jgi:hypothetical protein